MLNHILKDKTKYKTVMYEYIKYVLLKRTTVRNFTHNCTNEGGNKLKINLYKLEKILSCNNKTAFEL